VSTSPCATAAFFRDGGSTTHSTTADSTAGWEPLVADGIHPRTTTPDRNSVPGLGTPYGIAAACPSHPVLSPGVAPGVPGVASGVTQEFTAPVGEQTPIPSVSRAKESSPAMGFAAPGMSFCAGVAQAQMAPAPAAVAAPAPAEASSTTELVDGLPKTGKRKYSGAGAHTKSPCDDDPMDDPMTRDKCQLWDDVHALPEVCKVCVEAQSARIPVGPCTLDKWTQLFDEVRDWARDPTKGGGAFNIKNNGGKASRSFGGGGHKCSGRRRRLACTFSGCLWGLEYSEVICQSNEPLHKSDLAWALTKATFVHSGDDHLKKSEAEVRRLPA
jgi:hypothetical protein